MVLRQWEALKDYWRTNTPVEKVSMMSMARQKVTEVSQVGRKEKAGSEAIPVSPFTTTHSFLNMCHCIVGVARNRHP